MERITLQDLQSLWNESSTPCVSIFLPTHLKGAGTQADPIVLKNLLRQASDRLAQTELRDADARALLAPAGALAGDQAFWKEQSAGLAVFISRNGLRTFHLAHAPTERVVVTDRFHTRPLLACLEDNRVFHVLAVSLNAVRLLRVTGAEVTEVPLPNAPHSLKDFQKYEQSEGDAQYRQGGAGGTFAAGGRQADRKDAERRYLRAIARAVEPHLREGEAPLVFAGVEDLFAPYREVAGPGALAREPIHGNPDRLTGAALRDEALRVLAPLWEAELAQAAADYRRLAGTGRTAEGLARVLPAAATGQVGMLLLPRDVERWGRFTGHDGVEVHAQPEAGDDELLDLAASLTLRTGGRVLSLPQSLSNGDGPADGVAALLRY